MKEDAYIMEMLRHVMHINHEQQTAKVAKYYKGEAKQFPVGSLVQNHLDRRNQDNIKAMKLAWNWSGPYLFRGAINDTMGRIEQQVNRKPTGLVRKVHLSQLRLYLRPEQYEHELNRPDFCNPNSLASMGDSTKTAETPNCRTRLWAGRPHPPESILRVRLAVQDWSQPDREQASQEGTMSPIRQTAAWREMCATICLHTFRKETK